MLRRFASDERGSMGMIFALGSVSLLGAVSASLDYARMTNTRASLAASVDAAALAAAQAPAQDMASTARNVFDANFRGSHTVTSFSAAAIKNGSSDAVRVEAVADVKMTLSQVIGFTTQPVRAVTEVVVGNDAEDIHLALVLDVTGSMAGAKLAALKTAASDMANTLYDKLSQANRVKMAVVPFAEYVNVGLSNRNKPWMSVPNNSSSTQQVCGQKRDVTRSYNCRTEYRTWNSCNDGVCTQHGGDVQVCDQEYGPYYQTCQNQTTTVKWNGCAGSRNYPLNVMDDNYASNPVPGVMNVSCPPQLTALSSSRPTVLNAISALTAGGETYLPSGLMWGWAALSPGEPFSEPQNPNRNYSRYLVLMTDGANTRSPNYPAHNGSNSTLADALTSELCTNIKAAGIILFTISLDVHSNLIKNQLRICASSPDMYFDALDSAQLSASFKGITSRLTELRLSK